MTVGWRVALIALGFSIGGLGASAILFELLLPDAAVWVRLCSADAGGYFCCAAEFLVRYWWMLLVPWFAGLLLISVLMACRVVTGVERSDR